VGIFDRLDKLADQLGDLIGSDDVRAHVELGAAYLERGDVDSAIYELGLAVELRPDHPRAAYLLGLAYGKKGDYDAAAEALGRAAAIKSGFAEPHVALGELWRRRGHKEAAAESYRLALEADIGDGTLRGEALRGLGAVYLASGRVDKAVRELRKAAALLPDDVENASLLGRALYLRGGVADLDLARTVLERIGDAPPPLALLTLGELTRDAERARGLLERAVIDAPASTEIDARLALARLHLAGGRAAEAHAEAVRALALAPERPDLLVALATASAAGGSYESALGAFDRALVSTGGGDHAGFDRNSTIVAALRVALRAELYERAASYAAALPEDPPNPDALAALALAARSDAPRARGLADRAVATGPTVEAWLASATLASATGDNARAAVELRRAARLDLRDARPRERLAALYRAVRDNSARTVDAVLRTAHRTFAAAPELAELVPEAGRLVEALDRPLLITVMGEFNAGKSSFVNALLGAEVAPMGITPTTATINMLKYGAERKGRVLYSDGTSRDVPWDKVPGLLRGLDAAEAARIRVVEVLAPVETLQRVNVVDTPGLNSIHPEHEATARKFIAEADAVVWLFSVDQAAKASEGEALAAIRAEGRKVLGVLNKIDRADESERAQILKHVQGALGEKLEAIVPYSAREVLLARRENPPDDARLKSANHDGLERALEERFFSRARKIQGEVSLGRLRNLVERGKKIAAPLIARAENQRDSAAGIAARIVEAGQAFEREYLRTERSRLYAATDAMAASAAREVLDFVRPRTWVFGSNQAAPADRDFLLALLDERLGSVLEESRRRTDAELRRSVESAGGTVADSTRLLDAEVYTRFRAFARGVLRGGRVDEFFTRVLPKIKLDERELRRALDRDAPWVNESADAELLGPLGAFARRYFADAVAAVEHSRDDADLDAFDLEARIVAPLDALIAIGEKDT
jgi:small GTP-binding protein